MDTGRFLAPGLQSPKVILLAKILVSKQKTNQIFIATSEKIKFHLFKKTAYGSFGQGLAMETCKTKAIQAYSDIGRHIKVLFGHIQAYSESFVTLIYSDIFRTLVYMQNQKQIQSRGIFRILSNIYDDAFSQK